jgi:DNA processing protein
MKTDEKEQIYAMALAKQQFFNLAETRYLFDAMGSATSIVEHCNDIPDRIPDASPRVLEALRDIAPWVEQAKEELQYANKHNIQVLTLTDEDYPQRLKECDDSPLVLFYKGSADLNARRVVCIVGTRRCTVYAQDLIRRFMADMRENCPEVLVVSGLAYGVDICAHSEALMCGYPTVGVLAHGLDDLYPARHKATAQKMVGQGGLLTEYTTHTNADKMNFVRRNRIVAGMSDACILVESAAHGGGIITAELAREYNREVFAFPGRVGDHFSEGCNNLIAKNVAMLLTGADSFIKTMGWESDVKLVKAHKQGIPRQLFPELTEDEQKVVNVLTHQNDLQINMLSVQSNMPIGKLTAVLFQLEMKGVVRTLAGGMYHLLK